MQRTGQYGRTKNNMRAPSQLPSFAALVEDIGATPRAISKFLGVSERTFWAWKSERNPPRAVLLALFWESRWGQSLYETTIDNGRRYHFAHVASLEREIARLKEQIARTSKLSDTANAPVFRQA